MAKGFKTGGRQPGSLNKTTASVKQALLSAFDELGGVPALVEWARSEPTEFYKLYAKLLPAELKTDVYMTDLSISERLGRMRRRNQDVDNLSPITVFDMSASPIPDER
jgi:hypothetical protein